MKQFPCMTWPSKATPPRLRFSVRMELVPVDAVLQESVVSLRKQLRCHEDNNKTAVKTSRTWEVYLDEWSNKEQRRGFSVWTGNQVNTGRATTREKNNTTASTQPTHTQTYTEEGLIMGSHIDQIGPSLIVLQTVILKMDYFCPATSVLISPFYKQPLLMTWKTEPMALLCSAACDASGTF